MAISIPPRSLSFAVLALLAGCQGLVGGGAAGPTAENAPTANDDESNAGASGTPFAVSQAATNLLPFEVRLAKVAATVGVAVDDPILDSVRAMRIGLGDYDFASGVLPDLTWTPSRVAAWVRALRPVCQSTEFTTRFSNLPEQLPELISAAYGRDSSPDDMADMDTAFDGAGLDGATQSEITCLAVMSSAEMVLQ